MPTIPMRLLWRTLRLSATRNSALPLIRLNALLQAGVVDVAERAKHSVQPIEPAFGAKSREASLGFGLEAAEEPGERLVEPTQYLLFGAIAIPGKPVIGEPHRLQFVRLIDVTKAPALPLIRLNALLQARVVEVAEGAKHAVQRHGLRSGRIEAVLIGPPHSTALLRFDIASDRVLRDGANRGREIAAAPKCWQPRPERGELLPPNAAASSFQPIDDPGDKKA